jgi:hypothetical protein
MRRENVQSWFGCVKAGYYVGNEVVGRLLYLPSQSTPRVAYGITEEDEPIWCVNLHLEPNLQVLVVCH